MGGVLSRRVIAVDSCRTLAYRHNPTPPFHRATGLAHCLLFTCSSGVRGSVIGAFLDSIRLATTTIGSRRAARLTLALSLCIWGCGVLMMHVQSLDSLSWSSAGYCPIIISFPAMCFLCERDKKTAAASSSLSKP